MSRSLPVTCEAELRARFAVREELFKHGERSLRILLPEKAEDLLDEEAFLSDERMPYWADLWPSAKALARWILDVGSLPSPALELGCGVALPSIAMQLRGNDVLATDYNDDALAFAQCNAWRNLVGELRTQPLDWRALPDDFGAFDVVYAADVLYEQRNAIALAELLPRIVSPGGRFILADPNRRHLGSFQQLMRQTHWVETQLAEINETQLTSTGAVTSRIRILEYRRRCYPPN